MSTSTNAIDGIRKARLLISDYTLTASKEEKEIFLRIAGGYIFQSENPEIILIYHQVCSATNESDKDTYLEILIDLLDAHESTAQN